MRIALALAGAFMLFLFPFWWSGGALLNLAFALVLLRMASFDYPRSIPELLSRRPDASA